MLSHFQRSKHNAHRSYRCARPSTVFWTRVVKRGGGTLDLLVLRKNDAIKTRRMLPMLKEHAM
jgi:hypothetical protein